MDERTWLDNVGRPHSWEARVEERYFRRDAKHIDVTITINDPTLLLEAVGGARSVAAAAAARHLRHREMECSPSEFARYTKEFAEPAAGVENTAPR